jgi:hypothetical protein
MRDELDACDSGDVTTDAHARALGLGIVITFLLACAGVLTSFLVGTAVSLLWVLR